MPPEPPVFAQTAPIMAPVMPPLGAALRGVDLPPVVMPEEDYPQAENMFRGDVDDWAEPFAGKGRKEPPFPLKLHQILGNPEFSECICWNAHGRSWRILKPPVFEQVVIPLYFRHAK